MLNFRWFTLVGTGMFVHLSEICLLGMCERRKELAPPNLGSALFTFATLVIIAAHSLIPSAMCNMNRVAALIFEMGLSLVICDFSLQTMWYPLLALLERLLITFSEVVKSVCETVGISEHCSYFTYVFESKTLLQALGSFIAIALTIYTVDSTDTFTAFREFISAYTKVGCPEEPIDPRSRCRNRQSRSRNRQACDSLLHGEDYYEDDEDE